MSPLPVGLGLSLLLRVLRRADALPGRLSLSGVDSVELRQPVMNVPIQA